MPPSPRKYSHSLFKTVIRTISDYHMFYGGESVLVGVSGGPDSVALLHVLNRLSDRFGLKLGVAHLDHCLRNEKSRQDAEFVRSLADTLNLPFHSDRQNVRGFQRERKLSLEEAARQVRYRFYDRIRKQHRYQKIALGHQQNDNAELMLMYFFRGSGAVGLSGIPPVRDNTIVRPLIAAARADIIDFLRAEGLAYVSDASNRDMRFLRNRIRHRLIPELQAAYNPALVPTLARTAAVLRAEDTWMDAESAAAYRQALAKTEEDRHHLSTAALAKMNPAVLRRVIRRAISVQKGDLRRIGFSHIASIAELLNRPAPGGSLDLPGRIRVIRLAKTLVFVRAKDSLRRLTAAAQMEGPLKVPADYRYRVDIPGIVRIGEINRKIAFSKVEKGPAPDFGRLPKAVAFFDMDRLRFPLELRNARPGDRFVPLGMQGSQKINRFFMNLKMPRAERRRCPLLVSGGQVVWVVGHRIADAVKVTPFTQKLLKAELLLA